MKKMKQILSVALVLILALAFAVPAFAANPETGTAPATKGSITINNATANATYNAYRILDLQSYEDDGTTQKYAYVTNEKWKQFFEKDPIAQKYVKVDTNNGGTIEWIGQKDTASVQEFGKAAKKWAAEEPAVEPDYRAQTEGGTMADGNSQAVDGVAKFENLELGYYLVFADGIAVDAAVALDTTNADIIMREKNEVPAIGKVVEEDTASLGKTLHYTIPVIIGGADLETYTITDTMTGIKIDEETIQVKAYEKPSTSVDLKNFTTEGLTEKRTWADTDYTVEAAPYKNPETSYVMKITLKKDALQQLNPGDIVVVTYNAEATKLVVVQNKAKLDYSNDPTGQGTPEVTVETKNFAFNLKKTNDAKEILQDAEFKLYEDNGGKPADKAINFVKNDNSYKVATTDDNTTTEVIKAGNVKIEGLGAGTYYLEETKAPTGYNKLLEKVIIKIDPTGAVSINWNGTDKGEFISAEHAQENSDYTITVVNKTGTELPSTGGMGTTVFYLVGGLLMAVAAVAFIAKKRMAQ